MDTGIQLKLSTLVESAIDLFYRPTLGTLEIRNDLFFIVFVSVAFTKTHSELEVHTFNTSTKEG